MDQTAINQAFSSLIDKLGLLLDQIFLTGSYDFWKEDKVLNSYFHFLQRLEKELLTHWKIKEDQGFEVLIKTQKQWLRQELRNPDGLIGLWNRFCGAIWEYEEKTPIFLHPDPWKSLLLQTLSDQETHKKYQGSKNSEEYKEILGRVIDLYHHLYDESPYDQMISFLNLIEIGSEERPSIHKPSSLLKLPRDEWDLQKNLRELFGPILESQNWDGLTDRLEQFWQKHSGGKFDLFPAFQLRHDERALAVEGVKLKRWITFGDLVGIEKIREKLTGNIRNFLRYGIGHHVLLWGGRGTGKSSSIVALLAENIQDGLRLIEVEQRDLHHLTEIYSMLKPLPEKFILFCDDISFGESDTSYKHLKSLMEGSLARPAANILIHATSNKKDLVQRGYIDERQIEERQILDEMRAIDDRFGLKLYYDFPIYDKLTEILFHYAEKSGFPYDKEALKKEFMKFCLQNNHDSPAGRTVKQFITTWGKDQKQ